MAAERNGTYPPLDTLKPVADGVWIVDSGPLSVFGIKLPVRMTVVRLADGGLWLHSPTRLDRGLQAELERIGLVRHLVAPDIAHWSFLEEWQRACPDAVTWAAPGLRRRAAVKRSSVRLDRDLEEGPPPAWLGEMEQAIVPGAGGFSEVDFFHKPTRTLVLTDLVVNLEAERLAPSMRLFSRLMGVLAPDGMATLYLRLLIKARREEAEPVARRLLAWQPERVIFSHGRWFENGGAARLKRSLRWLLKDG